VSDDKRGAGERRIEHRPGRRNVRAISGVDLRAQYSSTEVHADHARARETGPPRQSGPSRHPTSRDPCPDRKPPSLCLSRKCDSIRPGRSGGDPRSPLNCRSWQRAVVVDEPQDAGDDRGGQQPALRGHALSRAGWPCIASIGESLARFIDRDRLRVFRSDARASERHTAGDHQW
jgi:hypothetical protein